MNNDYLFWENYLVLVREEIKKICDKKDGLYIDLHIHSNYSSDGKQSVNDIIKTTNDKGFDIIAITDHDSLAVYDELYGIVKNGLTNPIIIPGIEFTIDSFEYGNQCHILQLFVNPKDNTILKDVNKNMNAMFNRSKIQFKRLRESLAIKEIVKKTKIRLSYDEYLEYLKNNNLVPEYDTLCEYLINKFKKVNVTTFDILELLEKYNKEDCYDDRKNFKENRYNKLKEKYEKKHENYYNTRFLLSMLAVREVDDDWWNKPSSGSLSVNSFGQIKIDELNEKYPTYFAHPTGNKLDVVERIIQKKKSIIGMEENIRNEDPCIKQFNSLLDKMNLIRIIGSDSHDSSLKYYNNMLFYKIDSDCLRKML